MVRHGSLTEAASSLFISLSTLSHRLTQLEREVGMNLIDRGRGTPNIIVNFQRAGIFIAGQIDGRPLFRRPARSVPAPKAC
ncbi:helix-turn-helix domain-containing protein [Paenibacillus brasilensis]|uniref:helix-turn-helix domain-containing protein n=1 Tax=Paenibacillus brasilensis TaxID=128574 RepID=UPI001FCA79C9|nr:LysR family transcriptional regulator [Paenibacillus brasilensis]